MLDLDYIETHLVDHCNLNCKGCSHFSPLSGRKFADLDAFKRDFLRLRELFDNIVVIRLMGGEPLLHPEANSFLKVARSVFPDANIQLVTNGTLLLKQDAPLWETCSRNDILIQISRYPIKLDVDGLEKKCADARVRLEFTEPATRFYKHINLAGDSDPAAAFADCQSIYRCPHLREGKISVCRMPALVHIFNGAFGKNIPVSGEDFLDIHGNVTAHDILTFLERPVPLCRWCLTDWPSFEWGVTRKNIREWTGTNPSRLALLAEQWRSSVARGVRRSLSLIERSLLRKKRQLLGKSTGRITAHPNPVRGKSKYRNIGSTTLTWTAEGIETVEVRVGAPDGTLFSRSGPAGSETTGEWVREGTVFYLQDVTDGLSLDTSNTIDKVEIDVCR